ncbi:E3 ubiquitin-protein ligase Zswim2 [Cytospora mali]|uniref:E3 ubiquitin-protein ligase Zswim2 n=1 Tax=Cytospora mali TaxID=578113 RepID=A0A194UWX3_CYTMA|nr:E3 ubiquitin-protein ligase Zswim2 [Valsa mali var. pyri (nom. inval.)]
MGVEPNQSVYDAPSLSTHKRKAAEAATASDAYQTECIDEPKRKKTSRSAASQAGEKRLRRYRPKAPQSFFEIYNRSTTQRFFVLSRVRCGTQECPEELVELTGSTGNIYIVCIAKQPTCDCPHAKAGNQCKHVVYVLARVLRAKLEYTYQLALLSTELQEIFASAPPIVDETGAGGGEKDKNRKAVDGDCPICFEEMEEGKEGIVWCKAACGQNIHKQCFEMWSSTKKKSDGAHAKVTCPYCRSVWEGDLDMVNKINKAVKVNAKGYRNVADQLGISKKRDYSTYSTWWSRHPQNRGHRYVERYEDDDDDGDDGDY